MNYAPPHLINGTSIHLLILTSYLKNINDITLGCESFHVGDIISSNSTNSENEFKLKTEHYLSDSVVTQKKAIFEKFVKSTFKDSKEMNRHFEVVKGLLGSKMEQVFLPETMIEYFDRISQKPISRIGNTKKTRWSDDEVLLLTHVAIYYTFNRQLDFETLVSNFVSSVFLPRKSIFCLFLCFYLIYCQSSPEKRLSRTLLIFFFNLNSPQKHGKI